MKKRAFSYIRMSTEAQMKGHSLERQLDMTRAYAKEKGFQLVEDLRDIGLSAHDGTNVEKGKLGEFLKAIELGEIEKDCVLLVESLDRLSRKSPRQAFSQFNDILDYGIEIHTIFDRQVYTSANVDLNPGLLFSSIGFMLRAHSESEEKSRRLKKRWQSNRDNLDTRILTTVCPAWLEAKADKTGFKLIASRAHIIKRIFELCIDEGMGAYAIAKYFNDNPVIFPRFTKAEKRNRSQLGGNKTGWQKSYILKILNNPAVYGDFQPRELVDGKRIASSAVRENYFPQVITKERFLLAQAKLHDRASTGGGRKGDHFNNIFTKLLICGHCGAAIHFIDKGPPPKGGKYLRCSNALLGHKCKMGAWKYADLEKMFFKFVGEVDFKTALTGGNEKSKRAKLINDLQIIDEKLRIQTTRFDNLLKFDTGEDLPASAVDRVRENIKSVGSEISVLEDQKREMSVALAKVQDKSATVHGTELINLINNIQEEATDAEKGAIRRRIHNQISNIVLNMKMFGDSEKNNFGRTCLIQFKNGKFKALMLNRNIVWTQTNEARDWQLAAVKAAQNKKPKKSKD